MLFKETITAETLDIIHQLFTIDELKDFELVGGTSLSLQIGHRISFDIDLFCQNSFETGKLKEILVEKFNKHQITFDFEAKNTLIGSIDQVKFDFIRHNYPKLRESAIVEGLRLCSLEDIAAMKIGAITDNGTRLKDFIDLYYLLHKFSLEEILVFYEKKYKHENSFHALKSITYFDNLENKDTALINFLPDKQISFSQLKTVLLNESKKIIS